MPLQTCYTPNYFSIDDILATQERIPCKFVVDIPKLGSINPAAEANDLEAGTSLELPVWMVQQLSSGRQPPISVELPRIYKESYREILTADACAVDLNKFGLYFYELGSYVRQFDPRGDVSRILLHTFQTRFRQLLDLADNTGSDPTALDRLDSLECRLFKDGHVARARLNDWLINSGAPIEAARMVVNHKKRKRINVEDVL